MYSYRSKDIKEQFGAMVTDVIEKLTGHPDISLRQNVLKEIKEWSQFLKPSRTGITEERLRGLWGEMWCLTEYVILLWSKRFYRLLDSARA